MGCEGPETPERISDVSEPSGDEKSIMVCKHWKSKGWCRLESKCKFLHPEHKRGVCSLVDIAGKDLTALPTSSQRRRKRGGKRRASTGKDEAALLCCNC